MATDSSARQIASAPSRPGIHYVVCAAEECALGARSTDLVTVAQALHWLDRGRFYAEARRVGAPGAVIAVWSYGLPSVSPAIDELIHHFYRDVIGSYWAPQRRLVEEGYQHISFPFPEFELPRFSLQADWDGERFLGYLGTWSAVRNYIAQNRANPLDLIASEIVRLWSGAGGRLRVSWPLSARAGRIEPG